MSYKYTAFISYRRKDPAAEWVAKYFLKILTEKLGDLHYNDKVFIDSRDINIGDEWDKEIKVGLSQSMFLIPIFSPSYFEVDKYAIMEFVYMHNRMQKFSDIYENKKAILPIIYGNKDHFKCPYNMVDLYCTTGKIDDSKESFLRDEVDKIARIINSKSKTQPEYIDGFYDESLFEMNPQELNELCRSIYTEFDKKNNFSVNMF